MEEMVGKAIAGRQEDIVLATKVYSLISDECNYQGGPRRWLLSNSVTSQRRINADHINRERAGRKIFL